MRARLRSWWYKIEQQRAWFYVWRHKTKQQQVRAAIITSVVALGIVLVVAFIGGYHFHWDWTGLGTYTSPSHPKDSDFQRDKTLWDWLQLLIIPIALALVAIWFNRNERKNEQKIASDNQQEAAMQEYIKDISELLLHEKLRESQPGDEVGTIARVRTLTVLPHLESKRKRSILKFLYEAHLIDADKCIVDLSGADLSHVCILGSDRKDTHRDFELWGILHKVSLDEIQSDMSKVNLSGANLYKADLHGINMIEADLSGATLHGADLVGADLSRANLCRTTLTNANLAAANLSGANLSGSILIEANLNGADLSGANLSGAYLWCANLYDAVLNDADLSDTELGVGDISAFGVTIPFGANVTVEQLAQVKSLKGATMRDGSIYE